MVHNATTNNEGPQHRSLIMYHHEKHEEIIMAKIKQEQAKITDFSKKIETQVLKNLQFWPANQEH